MLILAYTTFGQQIRSRDIDIEDLMTLLRASSGYELFSFDTSEMLNERYNVHFIKKEFEAGEKIGVSNITVTPNKRLLTDIPEEHRQKAIDLGLIIDYERQAISFLDRINFGFYPSRNDSIKMMQLDIPGIMTHRTRFNLRGLTATNSDVTRYMYHARPFRLETITENDFIPLLLLGSAWYDKRFNIFRFCTEIEISPDMSSETLKLMPHYFIVGVKFDRSN
jgi:hypothetical protein